VLALFALRRPDARYRPTLYLFIAFILLCGATHFMAIVVIWEPLYEIQGLIKAATALASLTTAIILWPLLPKALALPSTAQLEAKNRELASEVDRRRSAERELTTLTWSLEARVEERTQELVRTNEALRQYAATASHDLQAPLRHITMFAQLLEREASADLSDGAREMIGNIVGSTQRMRRMIESLLEYSKLVDQEPATDAILPETIISAAVEARGPDIAAAGARIEVDLPPETIVGDTDMLVRLFDNLIDNALKYRSEYPLVVAISAQAENGMMRFSVTDNGIGVPKEFARRIFEMLRRLHAEADIPGTGIGLSLCQRIVESHGGAIWLDDSHTGGARFLFTLPLDTGEN
jgi:signal transduction histidine kinase